ncbi:MAG: hypothetical protein KBD00_04080 [Candidatus Peribacteraceae bacterium]|nr:hypothetical protein [Candidatus Peribacteraceae bacterium]
MDAPKASPEAAKTALVTTEKSAPAQVFQPQKLTEIVEMIDLMGKISERMGEDKASDMGGGSQGSGAQAQVTGTSSRDEAIANLPVPPKMQEKIIAHIHSEVHALDKQAHKLAKSRSKGSAYALTEIYKKIRRLSSVIDELLGASADMIKRFYIALFIDRQTLGEDGGLLARSGK